MGEKLKPNFSEVPRLQMEVIGQLGGLWEKTGEARRGYSEALRKGGVVKEFRCMDARDVKSVPSALKTGAPWVDSIGGIAGYPRPDPEELIDLSEGAGLINVTSHWDPRGLVNESGEDSICGGEDAKFSCFSNPLFEVLESARDLAAVDEITLNAAMGQYLKLSSAGLQTHRIPQDTSRAIIRDVFWAIDERKAINFWGDYLPDSKWKDGFLTGVMENLPAFRDSDNLGLDAMVRTYAYAMMLRDMGVVEPKMSTSLVNHRIQAAVPLTVVEINKDGVVEMYLPGGMGFSSNYGDFGGLISSWSSLIFKEGKLQTVESGPWQNELTERYFKHARQSKRVDGLSEQTATQGDFYLYLDGTSKMPALVYAGEILKHGGAFGGRLLGFDQREISYRSMHTIDQTGYGSAHHDKGLIVFGDSREEVMADLNYCFLESWGRGYERKDRTVAVVVKEENGQMEMTPFGTKITASEVKLIEVAR